MTPTEGEDHIRREVARQAIGLSDEDVDAIADLACKFFRRTVGRTNGMGWDIAIPATCAFVTAVVMSVRDQRFPRPQKPREPWENPEWNGDL